MRLDVARAGVADRAVHAVRQPLVPRHLDRLVVARADRHQLLVDRAELRLAAASARAAESSRAVFRAPASGIRPTNGFGTSSLRNASPSTICSRVRLLIGRVTPIFRVALPMYDTSSTLRHGSSCCRPIDHWWNSGIFAIADVVADARAERRRRTLRRARPAAGCRSGTGCSAGSPACGWRRATRRTSSCGVKPVDVPRSVDESQVGQAVAAADDGLRRHL